MIKAQVHRSAKRIFDCSIEGDSKVVPATALREAIKKYKHIVVGDKVWLENETSGDGYQIVDIEKRNSEISRFSPREGKSKVIAANCDLLAILVAVSLPTYKRGLVDRYLVRAHQWGIKTILIFNKMDQVSDEAVDLQFEMERVKPLGVECFEISAKFPDSVQPKFGKGMEELNQQLQGKTCIFLGQSGVGKSKTVNALSGGEFSLKSEALGKEGKGAHTTTWAELIDCGKFKMIDSPGIRSLALDDIAQEDLISFFPDLEELSTKCKFSDCKHKKGTKGCFFYSAGLSFEGNQKVILSRLESYHRILDEVIQTPSWKK